MRSFNNPVFCYIFRYPYVIVQNLDSIVTSIGQINITIRVYSEVRGIFVIEFPYLSDFFTDGCKLHPGSD